MRARIHFAAARPTILGGEVWRGLVSDQPISAMGNHVISGAGLDFRFSPESDRIAALRQPTLWTKDLHFEA
jgi:hypothetical protein